AGVHYEPGEELETLQECFPGFLQAIIGSRVVDFGCGYGYQSLALARAGAKVVIGVDVDGEMVQHLRAKAAEQELSDRVFAEGAVSDVMRADLVISKNSFEHFLEPEEALAQVRRCLAPGGKILTTFSPPWNAPFGAHMAFFCYLPWVHLLFSE